MIVNLELSNVAETEKLVYRVFPWQNPLERSFYWAWRLRETFFVRFLMRMAGIAAIEDTWVYLDQQGKVRGTIGLYARTEDEAEARWVSWFCVDPASRGQGIGKGLLTHLIGEVRSRGYRYLRLYTGSDPDEAAAQVLYESRGLREIRRQPFLFTPYKKIWRELDLKKETLSKRMEKKPDIQGEEAQNE